MSRHHIKSNSPFEDQIGFSRSVRVGKMLFVSGTGPVPESPSQRCSNRLFEQVCRCIEIMKMAIEAGGGTLEDVVRTRIYLVDISEWEEAARAHRKYFKDIRPACTFVEVSGFVDPLWLVETEADCVIDPTTS